MPVKIIRKTPGSPTPLAEPLVDEPCCNFVDNDVRRPGYNDPRVLTLQRCTECGELFKDARRQGLPRALCDAWKRKLHRQDKAR